MTAGSFHRRFVLLAPGPAFGFDMFGNFRDKDYVGDPSQVGTESKMLSPGLPAAAVFGSTT